MKKYHTDWFGFTKDFRNWRELVRFFENINPEHIIEDELEIYLYLNETTQYKIPVTVLKDCLS